MWVGPVIVGVYAAVMVMTIAVWDPEAAVPGLRYQQIVAGLGEAGVDIFGSVVNLIVWGFVGLVLALVLSILGLTGRVGLVPVIMGHLLVIAGGAPVYFFGSFSLGIDVADTFAVSGGVHVPTGDALYAVSGVALVVLAVVGIRRAANRQPALV
ncbi:hypothetical protein D6T64_02030 [Cryobacterium melibiosiphilum]|uniref:Uncharacterized protein n=1 Tax=Cryobacterium melibiosiphilum TaxID=995039 RepID=A0A3A5MVS1_9MICO|nr:hypothetical protein D6T64_02030 [Cryobacterium melibiosiphilum]